MPPSQPNGIVFYNVSLSKQGDETDHKILFFVLYDSYMVINKLKKYTSYLLKITPATEKGFSEVHTANLHIRTEEDGMCSIH